MTITKEEWCGNYLRTRNIENLLNNGDIYFAAAIAQNTIESGGTMADFARLLAEIYNQKFLDAENLGRLEQVNANVLTKADSVRGVDWLQLASGIWQLVSDMLVEQRQGSMES